MSDIPSDFPPGDYAIVELFGHQTLIGRVTEVERFGTKMLALECLFRGTLLPPVLQGGASIYRLTMCDAETAWRQQPKQEWSLPASIRATLPPLALSGPGDDALDVAEADEVTDQDGGEDLFA